MNRTTAITAVAAVLVLGAGRPALADIPGVAFGLGFQSHHILDDDEVDDDDGVDEGGVLEETGFGGNVWLGAGFTPSFVGRVALNVNGHGIDDDEIDADVRWGSLTAEVMYLFMDPEILRPYLVGGVGAYRGMTSDDDPVDFEVNGFGGLAGIGLLYFFNDSVAMDLAVRGEYISWEDASATIQVGDTELTSEGPIDDSSTVVNLMAGISFFP